MLILSIETSCDETAIALVEASGGLRNPKFKILKNLVASQIKIHRPYGGVVPNLAKREHLKNLPILYKRIMNNELGIKNKKIIIHNSKFIVPDLIAVTVGPGLEPALWTGINFAKELYKESRIKNKELRIIGASHLEAHLYSFLLSQKNRIMNNELRIRNRGKKPIIHNSKFIIQDIFPSIALIISGGHTILLLMEDLTHYKKLGETRDDAIGECFDKVARLLKLSYPGGPEIERLAKSGNPKAIQFPKPMLNQKNYDFSFSGLKTAVLYYLKDSEANIFSRNLRRRAGMVSRPWRDERAEEQASEHAGRAKRVEGKDLASDVAASFQAAALDVLIKKTLRAAKEFEAKSIIISGGVASNKTLQKQFQLEIKNCLPAEASAQAGKLEINFLVPLKKFCTDNAVMIAASGYLNYLRNKNRRLIARGDITLGK